MWGLFWVNGLGVVLIVAIVFWFWGKRGKGTVVTTDVVDITVEGGVYSPDTIQIKVGQPLTLRFTRLEENPCASVVVFAAFSISQELPLGKPVDIRVQPSETGIVEFTCQMGMYRGKLIIAE